MNMAKRKQGPRYASIAVFAASLCLLFGCQHVVPASARHVQIKGNRVPMTQAELQQDLQRISGTMSQRISQAAEPLAKSPEPRIAEQALRRVLLYQSSVLDIVSGQTPEANLLDLLVFTTLSRSAFEHHWVPEVFKADGLPILEALRASERDVWLLSDRVLTYEQQAQVHEYIRAWQVENPTQVWVEAVRLSDFSVLAGHAAEARKTRGLLASMTSVAKTADQALLLGERALFLGQRVPFLFRTQIRLGAKEVVADSLEQLDRTEGLLSRSEDLLKGFRDLRPTLEEAGSLTTRADGVVAEAQKLVDTLGPLAKSFTPLLELRGPENRRDPTRLEAVAENSRKATDNALMGLRELRAIAPSTPEAWAHVHDQLDATVTRWLLYAGLIGVTWIVTLCAGYYLVARALAERHKPARR